jgi:hypothetical protein
MSTPKNNPDEEVDLFCTGKRMFDTFLRLLMIHFMGHKVSRFCR